MEEIFLSKRYRTVCAICGQEWDEKLNIPDGYIYGSSVCRSCGESGNFNDPDMESYPSNIHNSEDAQRYLKLTVRDRAKFKGSTCSFCDKKSIGRIRMYPPDNDTPVVISGCEEHFSKVAEIHKEMNS